MDGGLNKNGGPWRFWDTMILREVCVFNLTANSCCSQAGSACKQKSSRPHRRAQLVAFPSRRYTFTEWGGVFFQFSGWQIEGGWWWLYIPWQIHVIFSNTYIFIHIHHTISRYSSKYRIVTRILHVDLWLFFSLEKKQQRLYLPHVFWFSSGDPEQKDPDHVCYISIYFLHGWYGSLVDVDS